MFVMPSDISQQASLLSAHQIGKCNHNKVAAKRIFFSQEEEGWGDVKCETDFWYMHTQENVKYINIFRF